MGKLQYDPNMTFAEVLMRWNGTLLPMVLKKPLFWVLFSLEVAMLLLEEGLLRYYDEGLPVLDWRAAMVPSSL
eukprot:2054967-Prymnesium_polylepis.1